MTQDIARGLRQTRANMLGTDEEQHYWDCHEAAGEIDRLRLTDAEREAIEVAAEAYAVDHGERFAETLRGLLERFSQFGIREPYRLQPIATPNPPSTSGEGTMPMDCTENVKK